MSDRRAAVEPRWTGPQTGGSSRFDRGKRASRGWWHTLLPPQASMFVQGNAEGCSSNPSSNPTPASPPAIHLHQQTWSRHQLLKSEALRPGVSRAAVQLRVTPPVYQCISQNGPLPPARLHRQFCHHCHATSSAYAMHRATVIYARLGESCQNRAVWREACDTSGTKRGGFKSKPDLTWASGSGAISARSGCRPGTITRQPRPPWCQCRSTWPPNSKAV